jgi:hypothetical protein
MNRCAWTWRRLIGAGRHSLEAAGRRSLPLNRNGIGWPAERWSLSASQAAEPHLGQGAPDRRRLMTLRIE